MVKRFVILTFLAGLIAPAASAGTPIVCAPAKMAKALTALQWPHEGIIGGTCKGVGKPRQGAYTGFRCVLTWQTNAGASGKVAAWAKPAAGGRVCGSTSSLRACKLLARGPLPGDPTVCSANDPGRCAEAAAKAAVVAKHGLQVNLVCAPAATIYAWTCTPTSGTYTVTFTRGVSGWATTVTP